MQEKLKILAVYFELPSMNFYKQSLKIIFQYCKSSHLKFSKAERKKLKAETSFIIVVVWSFLKARRKNTQNPLRLRSIYREREREEKWRHMTTMMRIKGRDHPASIKIQMTFCTTVAAFLFSSLGKIARKFIRWFCWWCRMMHCLY